MSKQQRLERVRELAREYSLALQREGLNQDPDEPEIVARIFTETLNEQNTMVGVSRSNNEDNESLLPRGALPRPPTILPEPYKLIVAGWKCPQCNVLPPTRVMPWQVAQVQVNPPVERVNVNVSANERLRLKQPTEDSTVLPLLTREEITARLNGLLKILRLCPGIRSARRGGCFNCAEQHSHRVCPYRRGTFCGKCGEPGMTHDDCPICYPEKYGLGVDIATPPAKTR
ncbi:hypothetical protein PV327_004053 [Microctonus hyperodae]|uniref:Uncharacterized protein n=1 Tax=Microctonus hyperodae TaxID=165561 RepID=A0AA39FBL4_MICHY|nr:hypothetical protein PV327_004053 [Microctonus hyperodae]